MCRCATLCSALNLLSLMLNTQNKFIAIPNYNKKWHRNIKKEEKPTSTYSTVPYQKNNTLNITETRDRMIFSFCLNILVLDNSFKSGGRAFHRRLPRKMCSFMSNNSVQVALFVNCVSTLKCARQCYPVGTWHTWWLICKLMVASSTPGHLKGTFTPANVVRAPSIRKFNRPVWPWPLTFLTEMEM